jgi:hypothetical protein
MTSACGADSQKFDVSTDTRTIERATTGQPDRNLITSGIDRGSCKSYMRNAIND